MNYKSLILLTLLSLQSLFAVDFTLSVMGSRRVHRGYSAVFAIKPRITAGVDEQAYISIKGLPPGSTYKLWDLEVGCCDGYALKISAQQPVQIFVPATAQPGSYPVTVTFRSFSGVSRSVSFPLQVLGSPQVARRPLPPNIKLPGRDLWEANMETFGRKHCTATEAQPGYEGYSWYYDGNRVYQQIGDLLNDRSFVACSQLFNDGYRAYVEKGNGNIPGWQYFPHGMYMNFGRTGNQLTQAAVKLMANGSPWAQNTYIHANMIDQGYTREMAYATQTVVFAERLGRPRPWKLRFLADSLLSHIEQWYVQRSGKPQPFMVALTAEALIDYYNLTKDPRIPGALKMVADGLWSGSWDPVSKSFLYEEFSNGTRVPSNDTNLLIVPLFGWVFRQTGESIYRERGDVIFNTGVRTAWLEGGKQFSQNYRWSFKYVWWRHNPAEVAAEPLGEALQKIAEEE